MITVTTRAIRGTPLRAVESQKGQTPLPTQLRSPHHNPRGPRFKSAEPKNPSAGTHQPPLVDAPSEKRGINPHRAATRAGPGHHPPKVSGSTDPQCPHEPSARLVRYFEIFARTKAFDPKNLARAHACHPQRAPVRPRDLCVREQILKLRRA